MPRQSHLLSTQEAADLLGLSDDFFEDLVGEYPWLRPILLGKGRRRIKRWDRQGIEALAYILKHPSTPVSEPLKGAEGG